MDGSDQYVTTDAKYAAQMDEMSGVGTGSSNMAPYPLYGIPGLGQETPTDSVPFWKKPMFCYTVGAAAGVGLGWVFFGWFRPKYMKKNLRKRKKKAEK